MSSTIEGRYLSTNDAKRDAGEVIISKLGEKIWQTQWSASDKPLTQYTHQQEYRVVAKGAWEALAYFDGKRLHGYFPNTPTSLTQIDPIKQQFMLGEFEADLQDDGSFAVRLGLWDGKPPKMGHDLTIQHNLDWAELTWSKVSG
jgi:hypothetical protein